MGRDNRLVVAAVAEVGENWVGRKERGMGVMAVVAAVDTVELGGETGVV